MVMDGNEGMAEPQFEKSTTTSSSPADAATANTDLETLPPSHILEDGRFIYLPPPNTAERSRFFERSIARHGLLDKAIADDKKQQQQEEKESKTKQPSRDKTAPKIHPLWIASARLESGGMNELNRAINLATLVNMNEFFTYTNVVDPRLVFDDAAAVSTSASGAGVGGTGTADGGAGSTSAAGVSSTSASLSVPPSSSSLSVPTKDGTGVSASAGTAALAAAQEQEQSRQIESLFCLKRKRQQFEQASRQLRRHQKRLKAGVYAQRVVDQRLFQLRQHWKLVLPEHGTKARLHAPRTNEVVAIDVDLYNSREGSVVDRDRDLNTRNYRRKISLAGRLASRVPRFATIELKDDFNVMSYQKMQKKKKKQQPCTTDNKTGKADSDGDVEVEDIDSSLTKDHKEDGVAGPDTVDTSIDVTKYTRAEPFAIADPNLGRVQENFDPSKIPMLNLQMEIHKSSTGFVQSARLEPAGTFSPVVVPNDNSNNEKDDETTTPTSNGDEELLISLQHSLFCANLFESMRNELDTEDEMDQPQVLAVGRGRSNKGLHNMAWLASESDENFVAPPSFLVGDSDYGGGLSALSVIHCHDGEVKVQLDCEYTLSIKLVEANAEEAVPNSNSSLGAGGGNKRSGSQSPEQLHVLCRALLLHAQEVHHRYSLETQAVQKTIVGKSGVTSEDTSTKSATADVPSKPSILQSCVSLGSKILFERRIRMTLSKVNKWIESKGGEKMEIQWLPLSIFDLHSQFSLGFRNVALDVVISGSDLVVTRIVNGGVYRKVHFRSEREFEINLKLEIRRAMR